MAYAHKSNMRLDKIEKIRNNSEVQTEAKYRATPLCRPAGLTD